MTSVLLIYPFFLSSGDRSVFRFPPLGIAYLAASLREAGHQVDLLDCTFLTRKAALKKAQSSPATVVGIYCMVTLMEDCLWFARKLRSHADLLLAGGPLPTCDPASFLNDFDVVIRGEGESTVIELLRAVEDRMDWRGIPGIAYASSGNSQGNTTSSFERNPRKPGNAECNMPITITEIRKFQASLDRIPFPARDLFPNRDYIHHGLRRYGYSVTTVMSTRGCPYQCEFCSNVVFGGSYRERSPENVVDEIQQALDLGYDRISFADDVFTLNKNRVIKVCEEIRKRDLHFEWECLGRVDSMDASTALAMKQAGCVRIYFGIESGNDGILKLMNKKITVDQASEAVKIAHQTGLQVGAFFIICYPGDTNDTVLETIRFATALPLDYLSFTLPYPLPGTALFERIKDRITRDWRPDDALFGNQVLVYKSEFSLLKMWFGIIKGSIQFRIRKHPGRISDIILKLFTRVTDGVFRWLK